MTNATDVDVGTELFRYLHDQKDLAKLLSQGRDEDGEPIVAIYRGNVPQYDQFLDEVIQCQMQDGDISEIYAGYRIDDFLVFEQRDEAYEFCLNGCGNDLPEDIFFDVQIVSDSMPAAIKIKKAFEKIIRRRLNRGCGPDPCEMIAPQKMCNVHICEAQITGAAENTQRLTSASDFGLTAFDLDLQLSPFWIE